MKDSHSDYDRIRERVHHRIARSGMSYTPQLIADLVRDESGVLSDRELFDILQSIRYESIGIGPLEQLLHRGNISDIVVNGPTEIWYSCGGGMIRSELKLGGVAEVRALAQRLAARCGVRLDDSHPFADGRLTRPDGSLVRFHAVLSPPAQESTYISLRFLGRARFRLEDLGLEEGAVKLLKECIAARHNILIVGGTGSGKTTLLSALLHEVSHEERIICLEDTAELNPDHPHVLHLISRGANSEGQGAITPAMLLKQCLRMRPDRIIIGEIRGAEVIDLLTALNTGHQGGAGTVHANSIEEFPARMEALAALGGMSPQALHSQLDAAVDIVVALKNRSVTCIGSYNKGRIEALWSATP